MTCSKLRTEIHITGILIPVVNNIMHVMIQKYEYVLNEAV